jgi:8-oxo-dGTP pyrophosphatase MutT (NUDIX family)
MTVKSPLEGAGFPAEGEIFPLRSIDLPVLEGEHPWHAAHRAEIAANWVNEIAANPALYDGEMVFQRQLTFADGRIEGRAHMVPFSAFLYWRKMARGSGGFHLFGLPLVMTSDGALIAIRMGQHTANPGRVYCAAGSMDRHDIIDGRCDIETNMRREVLEETGLDLDGAQSRSGYFATHGLNTVTIFRIFEFSRSAEQILAEIAAHMATDPEPEIDGAVVIRNADPEAHDYAFFMRPILKWLFDDREKN